MTTTPTDQKSQADKTAFAVKHRLVWKGAVLVDGDTIEATAEEQRGALIPAWLAHGWIVQPGSGQRSVTKAKKAAATPPTAAPAISKSGAFQFIARRLIDPSPDNPRKDFASDGARASLAELADSIKEQGIIEPLIVRPSPTDADRFELVAGERRWRAAAVADLDEVPCIVRDLDDVAALEVQTIENLQRRDINPMEEAQGYEKLMRKGRYKIADLVKKTGKSEASIYARLKLLECPPGIRAAIEQNRLSASTGELVARLEPELRGQAMDAILHPQSDAEKGEGEGGVLSFRQAKGWVQMNEAKLKAETEWQKTVKGHHLFKTASKVLTGEESGEVIFGGGWLRSESKAGYVKPGDVCYEDPEHRTWTELAQATGRELPGAVLACDPHGHKVVVLLSKPEAIAAMGDAIPDPEEYKRREQARRAAEQEEQAERQRQRVAAEQAEKAERERAGEEAARLVRCAAAATLPNEAEEPFLRFLVVSRFREILDYDPDDLIAALCAQGVPVAKEEEDAVIEPAWCQDYLHGCDVPKLRGWLTYFALRLGGYSEPDEEMINWAQDVFGRTDGPQTSAVGNPQTAEAAAA